MDINKYSKAIKSLTYSNNVLIRELRNITFLRNIYLKYFKRFDEKLRIYLTLACNLKCGYCVNNFHGKLYPFKHLSGKEWIKIINREGKDIVLTGGEPTLHKDFIQIVNGIDPKIDVRGYTNLVWTDKFLEEYIKKVKRKVDFYVSYHISSGDVQRFIEILKKLKKSGKFNGTVHTVCSDKNRIKELKKIFSKNGISIGVDDDQYGMFHESCSKKFRKKVICSKKLYLIAPNGVRFRCLSYLVRNKQPLEDLTKTKLLNPTFCDKCDDYGYCAPCDMLGEVVIKSIQRNY